VGNGMVQWGWAPLASEMGSGECGGDKCGVGKEVKREAASREKKQMNH
jgi:hypothetical protein